MSNVDLTSNTLNPTPVQLQKNEAVPVDRNLGITQIVSALSDAAAPRPIDDNTVSTVISQKSLELAIREINTTLATSNTNLAFSIDPTSKRTIIEVKDNETGDTILKLPGDAILRIAANIESLKGILFDQVL
ncbi:MAG: flagellar protein FlaG [Porticoccaceae bacterium]|nr:flagellar protein FlaG [Porticoccaceae bacterium]